MNQPTTRGEIVANYIGGGLFVGIAIVSILETAGRFLFTIIGG